MSSKQVNTSDFQRSLLAWYEKSHRQMPWRAPYGDLADPYHVWLSEIMLQQTTVVTVGAYFIKFTDKWPSIDALARADLDDVLTAWAGLGYYARARNLHKTAKIITGTYNGVFPNDEKSLLTLPGIGPYTAAAIASIAFDNQATVLDGNVERVVSRIYKIKDPLPKSKPILMARAETLSCGNAMPSAYSQAMMELGAMLCKPTKPQCDICPVSEHCTVYLDDLSIREQYPFKEKKKKRPKREGRVYWVYHPKTQSFLIRKRGEKGLFAKMMELPSHGWEKEDACNPQDINDLIEQEGQEIGRLKHVFTHFELNVDIVHIDITDHLPPNVLGWQWHPIDAIDAVAFPSLMQKIIKRALLSI